MSPWHRSINDRPNEVKTKFKYILESCLFWLMRIAVSAYNWCIFCLVCVLCYCSQVFKPHIFPFHHHLVFAFANYSLMCFVSKRKIENSFACETCPEKEIWHFLMFYPSLYPSRSVTLPNHVKVFDLFAKEGLLSMTNSFPRRLTASLYKWIETRIRNNFYQPVGNLPVR